MRRGCLPVALLCAACSSKSESAATGATATTTTSATTTGGTGGAGGAGGGSGTGGAGGMLPPADWSCVGNVQPFPKPMKATATAGRTYVDFLTQKKLPGLTVKVCGKSDVDCASPLDSKTTGMDGAVQLTMPLGSDGFDGYLEISGPDVSWLSFTAMPFRGDNAYTDQLVTLTELNALATLVSAQYDETRGHAVIAIDDCVPNQMQNNSSGAVVSIGNADAKTRIGYVTKGVPDKNATQTDPSGLVGVINLPVGPSSVTAKVKESGKTIGTYGFFTRKNTASSVYLPPLPAQ